MAKIEPEGLKGLKGIGSLSKEEYDSFVDRNKDIISKHGYDPSFINTLYNNKQFIDKFGVEQFKALPNANARNAMYKEAIVDEEWNKMYSPWNDDGTRDNSKGLGADWEKYSEMPLDSKIELMQSGWKTSQQMEEEKKNRRYTSMAGLDKVIDFVAGETINQIEEDKNASIRDTIYNNAAESLSSEYTTDIAEAYKNPGIVGSTDDDTKNKFIEAITPGSYRDRNGNANRGISEYAAHYGNGTDEDISSAMKDFSVDEMREVLAKKAVYDANLSPDLAATALNNEAQRYIKKHQSSLTRFGLFARDVGISALSYTADKVNGIYNVGLMAADAIGDKPVVYVDDQSNVLSLNDERITNNNGVLGYEGDDGEFHPVQQIEVDRTTLHNMGKNLDGSDDESYLNPTYWTKAEQFGVLDKDLQDQYEKIGSSPYKVAYDPNEESDLVYESFKMMSFGLADASSMLLPFGIGAAGKALSTAGKVGKVARGFGQAINSASKYLTASTRTGQLVQGGAGALGIAYAYNRGAFQEMLAENLAGAEQALVNGAMNDIYNRYQTDEAYKGQIDAQINSRASQLKSEYLNQAMREGRMDAVMDEQVLDNMLLSQAQREVLNGEVQNEVGRRQSSDEYAAVQERAINSAGNAAVNSFWPEAIKYGLVNTMGYRKWLYTNPTGTLRKVQNTFKSLKEVTTSGGKQRLVLDTSKFNTLKSKAGRFGKKALGQFWGGSWTNGTDDMMVDAAERVSRDSFRDYLNAYENGESLADTYDTWDKLYAYWKGAQASLGQETTWNAAAVGGFGSLVSFSPNMLNIAHLATKEGREAFKNTYMQRAQRNEDGTLKFGEDGKPIMEDVSLGENWRDRAAFFIQNGLLSEYYGAKQSERDMQQQADYLNQLLDDYQDFEIINDLVKSDIGRELALDTNNVNDQNTMRFIQALNAVRALNSLATNEREPGLLSSVVRNKMDFISKAAEMTAENNPFSEAEITQMLGEYYSANPSVTQSEENNMVALQNIARNAKKFQEASKAVEDAEAQVQKIEKTLGRRIVPAVRNQLILDQALNGHWQERLQAMKDEIGDTSNSGSITDAQMLLSLGSKANANNLIKVYEKQNAEITELLDEQKTKTAEAQADYDKAVKARKDAKTSDERLSTQKALEEAGAKLENAKQNEQYYEGLITKTSERKAQIERALKTQGEDKLGILTADEIFALDPVVRARMMAKENRSLYSKEQQAEITKLEQNLQMKDAESLQKVQDISRLTQRIASNAEAYNKMAENPEAAAIQLEGLRQLEAKAAYDLITRRHADIIVESINALEESAAAHPEATAEEKNDVIYNILKQVNPTILDIIDQEKLLSKYQKQIEDAKAWSKITSDINAVINDANESTEWKKNAKNNIDMIVQTATTKDDLMAKLEKVIDDTDGTVASSDMEKILKGLESLDYIRDSAVIESRNQRREREAAARKKIEEENRKREEAVKKAAEEAAAKKAAEEAKKAAELPKKEPMIIPVTATSRNGKPTSGQYTVVTDDDGFTHITFEGNPFVRRKMNLEEMKKHELSKEDIIGTREDYNDENIYNEFYNEFKGFYIDKVHIRPDGSVEIVLNELSGDEFPLTGKVALKVLDILFPELKSFETKKSTKGAKIVSTEDININLEETSEEASKESTPESEGGFITSADLATMLMEDDAEASSVNMGNMWSDASKPSQGELVVSLNKEGKNSSISFTLDGNKESLSLEADDWVFSKDNPNTPSEGQVEGDNITKDSPFKATSIEQVNGEWFFKGKFEGQDKESVVAVSNNFKLGDALQRQMSNREAAVAAKGMDTKNPHIVMEGDVEYAKSPTLAEEAAEGGVADSIVEIQEDVQDPNVSGEHTIDDSVNTLSGNAMSTFEPETLHEEGILKRKVGKKEGDSRNQYNAWMASFTDALGTTGIKLQDIIDTELSKILVANPHAKVKYVATRETENATHDNHVKTRLFLVLDYDNNENPGITRIHNKDNGGVIESEGKKYLIIGVAGYGDINSKDSAQLAINLARRDWYDIVFSKVANKAKGIGIGLLQKGRTKYFEEHPTERFRVLEGVSTEIVPGSLIPGYLVKRLETDEFEDHRPLSKILADENRNPQGLGFRSLRDLKWGIQELTKFLPIKERIENIMVPRNRESNSGNAFVLIPAGNGKYMPVKIDALMYNEMNSGALLSRVESSIAKLASPQYSIRRQALDELFKIFHLSPEGNNILIGKAGKNTVGFTTKGVYKPFSTVNIDGNPNAAQEIAKAFAQMNPRVNITPRVLENEVLLEQYDEAGALKIDAAFLRTVGSSYAIYPVDASGNMVVPQSVDNRTVGVSDSAYRNPNKQQVVYGGKFYVYDVVANTYTIAGETITKEGNEGLFRELDVNRQIIQNSLSSVKSDSNWSYYILSTGEHPDVVRVDKNSKHVESLSEEAAKKLIDEVNEKKAAEQRADAAKEKNQSNVKMTLEDEIPVDTFEEVDPETGEIILTSAPETVSEEKRKIEVERKEEGDNVNLKQDRDSYSDKSLEQTTDVVPTSPVQTFKNLVKNKKYMLNIFKAVANKWQDSPIKFDDKGKVIKNASVDAIETFLRDKKVPLDNIGTSDADIQAWMKTTLDCRF